MKPDPQITPDGLTRLEVFRLIGELGKNCARARFKGNEVHARKIESVIAFLKEEYHV